MKGKGNWIWLLVIVLLAALIGAYFLMDQSSEENERGEEVEEELEESRERAKEDVTEEEIEQYKEEGRNPFGETRDKSELTEEHYREYIHGMSHQKVKANEKWGFYLITEERINWLLDGLDEIEIEENKKVYQNILTRWSNDDFSQADEDHNTIWRMQNGTVGEAYGILSEEEEQAYINQAREGAVER